MYTEQEVSKLTGVAWAAGLFEGEGCITGNIRYPKQRHLAIAMTDRDVMENFVKIVGYGNLKGPYNRPLRKPYWNWFIAKRIEVVRIVNLFLPYLGERRGTKAIEALKHYEAAN